MTYSPGDIIVSCHPFFQILNHKDKNKRCDNCFILNDSLEACADCKHVFYCNEKCLNEDAVYHNLKECSIYAKHYENIERDDDRVLLRLWFMMEQNEAQFDKKYKLHDGNWRSFNDMMSHEEDIKLEPKFMGNFNQICDNFSEWEFNFDREKLFVLFGQYYINSFLIRDEHDMEIGCAMYIESSIFNHSCSPNAKAIFNGTKQEMRAIKHITPDQPILTNYIDLRNDRNERQNLLKQNWFFDCKCDKCESQSDAHIDYSLVKTLDTQINDFYDSCIQSDLREAYSIGLRLLPLYRDIYGEFHTHLTKLLVRIVEIAIKIKEHVGEQELKELVVNTERSISITHGDENLLSKAFRRLISTSNV